MDTASRARAFTGLVLGSLLLTGGCDPCSGVAQCAVDTYVAIDGQIVEAAAGRGVDGVRIDVVRVGGVSVQQDSLATVTADGGHWRVEFTAAAEGQLTAEIVVSATDGTSYRVRDVKLVTTTRRGEANVLERWVVNPYFAYAAELFVRGTNDERVVNAAVEFRRTGGVEVRGLATTDGVFRATSDFAGRVPLFTIQGQGIFTNAVGDVVGDLIVRRASDTSVVRGIRLGASYLYRQRPAIVRIGVGPSLLYQGEFYSRAGGARLAGVQVEFQRTGGVEVTVPSFSTVSGVDGRFSFPTRPLGAGTLQGRLVFRAPAPSTPETLLVALPTFDDDAGRFYGVIAAGAYLPYYGIVVGAFGSLDGVSVDVRRVSGIPVTPESFTTTTAEGGLFRLPLMPGALGSVVVDITFRPAPPLAALTVRGVTLTTADRTVADRSLGVFRLDVPPAAPTIAPR